MKKRNLNPLVITRVFIVCFVSSFLVSTGSTAFAKWERHSAAACNLSHYSNQDSEMRYIYDWGGQVVNYSGRGAFFICDIEDSDRFLKQNIRRVNVHGHDGSRTASVSAKACVTFYNGFGGSCGRRVSSGNSYTGRTTLRPPLTAWTSSTFAHFGYVLVTLPHDVFPAGGDTSTFYGYYISDI